MSEVSLSRRVFFEVHDALPRAGPGNRASTARALEACQPLPGPAAIVLDAGCGPGLQTVHLAELLPHARIVALDLRRAFLARVAARARAASGSARVLPVAADMRAPPVANASVDLVWSEGAGYAIGLALALRTWRTLLRANGRLAFTEAVWLESDVPDELRKWWRDGYPDMRTREDCLALVASSGYRLLDDFVLPSAAWWDDYYSPMEARVTELESRYGSEPEALRVLAECQREIDYYRRWPDCYGYLFVVATAVSSQDGSAQ